MKTLWFASLEQGRALAHCSGQLFLPWQLAQGAVTTVLWGGAVLVSGGIPGWGGNSKLCATERLGRNKYVFSQQQRGVGH